MIELIREEIEQRLEKKYLGAVVSITLPRWWRYREEENAHEEKWTKITGKLMRVAVELIAGEPMVVFNIGHKQYKADVNYFIENIKVHGNTHTGGTGGGRVPEAD